MHSWFVFTYIHTTKINLYICLYIHIHLHIHFSLLETWNLWGIHPGSQNTTSKKLPRNFQVYFAVEMEDSNSSDSAPGFFQEIIPNESGFGFHEPPKPWRIKVLAHLKTRLFAIQTSKPVGLGGPWFMWMNIHRKTWPFFGRWTYTW